MEQENQSIFKKWCFGVLAAIVILGVNESYNKVEKPTRIESVQTVKEKPVIENPAAEKPVVKKAQEVQAKPKLDEGAIIAMTEAVLKRNFDDAVVKKTTDGAILYNVLITSKGFTQTALSYNPNDSEAKAAYDIIVENMQDLCKACNKLLIENDLEGEFCVSIVNDVNTENVLLTTLEDTVVYSVFE